MQACTDFVPAVKDGVIVTNEYIGMTINETDANNFASTSHIE
jgi:hypothetical protein